jgi:hypothetical protein
MPLRNRSLEALANLQINRHTKRTVDTQVKLRRNGLHGGLHGLVVMRILGSSKQAMIFSYYLRGLKQLPTIR